MNGGSDLKAAYERLHELGGKISILEARMSVLESMNLGQKMDAMNEKLNRMQIIGGIILFILGASNLGRLLY